MSMRSVAEYLMGDSPMLVIPTVVLFLFATIFGVAVWRALRMKSSDAEQRANLALGIPTPAVAGAIDGKESSDV